MPSHQVNQVIEAANKVYQEAFQRLLALGFSNVDARKKVEENFLRVNNNPNLILTVEELCR